MRTRNLLMLSVPMAAATLAHGQLSISGQFSSGASLVGMTHDPVGGGAWVYPNFGSVLRQHSSDGSLLLSLPRPGGSADDADLEIVPASFTLGATLIPAGSLLYIDGESGVAEIYAVNPVTGAVLATLATGFGGSHVVGGGYHPLRSTIFLVQDRVPGGTAANRIAEVSTTTGAVLNTFVVTAVRPTFTVNYGDIDVAANGNLLIASSDESSLAEFTPTGAFVRELALPAGVTSLCGVSFDASTCQVWVAGTGGTVWRLQVAAGDPLCTRPCSTADFNCDNDLGTDADIETFFACLAGACPPPPCTSSADFNGDGDLGTDADIEAFFRVLSGGSC